MQDGTTKGNGAVPEGPAAADPVRVFREGVYPYANRMKRAKYERLKAGLQIELLKAQHWVRESGEKVVVPLDHAAGDAQAHCAELRVDHALAVVGEVLGVLAGLLAGFGRAAQGGDHVVDAALIEFLAPLPGPAIADRTADPVNHLGDLEQMPLGVEDVDRDGIGEVLVGEVPDPRRAIAENDPASTPNGTVRRPPRT